MSATGRRKARPRDRRFDKRREGGYDTGVIFAEARTNRSGASAKHIGRVSLQSQTKPFCKNVQNKLRVSKLVRRRQVSKLVRRKQVRRNIEDKFNDGENETSEEDNAVYINGNFGAVGCPQKRLVDFSINFSARASKLLKCQLDS